MKKLLRIFEVTVLFMSILSCFVFAEDITITTYYPSPFGSYRELTWVDLPNRSRGWLSSDQGSSIELGGLNAGGGPGTPYIDFHNDMVGGAAGNFDARIILTGDNTLEIQGADLTLNTASQATVDPLNGVGGYTAQPRFSYNNDTP